MSIHRTRYSEQTVEVVAHHPSHAPSYVRLEVFSDDGTERLRETDVVLTPDQARSLAAGLVTHADAAQDACPAGGTHTWTTDSGPRPRWAHGTPSAHCDECGAQSCTP